MPPADTEVYEGLRAAIDDGLDMAQVSLLVDAAMRDDDAGDPLLESYQRYRP
jgi:hypothetical protein